jgi:hypothetical protein
MQETHMKWALLRCFEGGYLKQSMCGNVRQKAFIFNEGN